MEVCILPSRIEVFGKTYHNRDFLKQNRFQWDPHNKVWHHQDLSKLNVFDKRVPVRDLRRTFLLTEKVSDDRKIAALKACESLPLDITKKIFNKVGFPKCSCRKMKHVACFNCNYACCEYAWPRWCVCLHSTQCPSHGCRCHGSHD
jgi:hypothetical protein